MREAFKIRVRIISAVIVLFALLLAGRLYAVQIMDGDEYALRANHQYAYPTQELYDRGQIIFETKDGKQVSGATLATGYIVAINPGLIEEPSDVFNNLSSLVDLEEESFLYQANKKDDPYEEIARRVPKVTADKIQDLELAGVQVFAERWRTYPGETLAAQTLGFVGYSADSGDSVNGLYGIERYYNDTLSREPGTGSVNFFAELFSNVSSSLLGDTRTGDIVTNIEPTVQLYLEGRLADVHSTWDSKVTGGIIMDPRTGAIYALAVQPTFDVNQYNEVDNPHVFGNPLVENIYEMGSIIKPLTMSIGLDTKAVTARTKYTDTGCIEADTARICNFDGEGRGRVDMQEVLSQSLNTGVAFVVEQIGTQTFSEYMKKLSIGSETGIDLPGEVPGLISNLDSPRFVEYATASFGQGIAMTPITTVRALSSLANDGVPVTPHVGKRIEFESGLSKEISFAPQDRVFKKETSEEITRMLVEVVDEALMHGEVALPHYSIAAKTGTAQIAKVGERGYYDDRFLHSFFGYFPAYDPQFLVFLYTVEPHGVRYASQTLTYPFMDLTQFLINYYEVPPDR